MCMYSQLCSLMMIIVFERNIKLFFIKRGKNHYRQEVLQGQVIVKLYMHAATIQQSTVSWFQQTTG